MRRLIASFNGGELSPLMLMRVDSDRAQNGCRIMQNMIPMVQGGAFQRPGTEFVSSTIDGNTAKSRLIPFRYSVTTNYLIELAAGEINFYSDGLRLESDSGTAISVTNPYSEADLFDVQYHQINDVVYLLHPSYPTQKLTRLSASSWSIEELTPKYPPMLDEDIKTTAAWGRFLSMVIDTSQTGTTGPTFSSDGALSFHVLARNLSASTALTINLQKNTGSWVTVKTWVVAAGSGSSFSNFLHEEVFNSTTSFRFTKSGSTSFNLQYDVARYDWPLARLEGTTLTPSATTGTGITVNASAQVFAEGHVGAYFEIANVRTALDSATNKSSTSLSLNSTAVSNSASFKVLGKWDIHTFGTWNGHLGVQRLDKDGVTWVNYRNWRSAGTRNVQDSGEFLEQETIRLTYDGVATGTNAFAVLEAIDPKIYGIIKVTAFVSSSEVTADVIKGLPSTNATKYWREGAWSAYRGYPRTATLYEQRLWFAGTKSHPQMVLASVTGDFENFQRTTLDDSAMLFNIADRESNPIVWLASKPEGLAIGTTSAEWLMSGAGTNEPITPTSVILREQSRYGSAQLQPETWNEVSLFAQRGAQKVREFVYAFERNGYVAPELTIFAEHILRPTIVQMAYSANPHALLWCVMSDGTFGVMSYERAQGVIAWSRIVFAGESVDDACQVESVATIYGRGTNTDEVWMILKRTSGRSVVRFDPSWWHNLNTGGTLNYLDFSVTTENPSPVTVIPRPAHIASGTPTVILADGVRYTHNWPSTTYTLPTAATTIQIGVTMTAEVQPARTEIQMADGTAQSRRFRCNKMTVSLYKSGTFQYRHDAGKPWDTKTQSPLTTGEIDLLIDNSHENSVDITLRNNSENPMNLLAIVAHLAPYG